MAVLMAVADKRWPHRALPRARPASQVRVGASLIRLLGSRN